MIISTSPSTSSVTSTTSATSRPIHISSGQVTVVEGAGAIAGALSEFDEPPSVSLLLAPGDVLVMYTDGLLESPTPRLAAEDLVAHLGRAVSEGAEVMDVIDDLIAAGQEPGNDDSDDTAVLVLRVDAVGASTTPST